VPPGRKTVLIVEDDPGTRQFFRLALSFGGFDVLEARGGFEALRMLDAHPADVVVLDLGLPGFGGEDVRKELESKAETRNIPVVIATGSPDDLSHIHADCILRKPIAPDELVATVRRCLDTRRR
jgi:two-component system phosphate regulon response regulator PhoB